MSPHLSRRVVHKAFVSRRGFSKCQSRLEAVKETNFFRGSSCLSLVVLCHLVVLFPGFVLSVTWLSL